MGCGCLVRLFLLGFFAVVAALVLGCFLVTRSVGPGFENGAFVYEVNGARKEVRLSTEAARRFDNKLTGKLSLQEQLEAVTGGVIVTEEELNSRALEELAARGLLNQEGIERAFIRLTPDGARAYVYTNADPLAVTLSGRLNFVVGNGRVTVSYDDVRAGRLPIGPVVDGVLRLADNRDDIENAITLVIPPQVQSIRVEEGRLRAVLNLPSVR
jgi:hypothetical protein